MAHEMVSELGLPSCRCCGSTFPVMKRCVQCQDVYYCSRQCQVKDWSHHKSQCLKKVLKEEVSGRSGYVQDDKCIFLDESDQTSSDTDTDLCQQKLSSIGEKITRPWPVVDFQTSFDDLKHTADLNASGVSEDIAEQLCLSYLHNNTFCSDVPVFESGKPFNAITVKSNKEKIQLQIQHDWDGAEIYKLFACKLHIPLEKLKIIHKGKMMSQKSIKDVITAKAVFQVVGEKSADETGIHKTDIDVMMSQLNTDRNSAVLALQKNRDLIDAILDATN